MAEYQAANSNVKQVIMGTLSSADLQVKIDQADTEITRLNARVTEVTAKKTAWQALKTSLDAA